jgi:glycosyltransferase involved in cell wall biosynthesis
VVSTQQPRVSIVTTLLHASPEQFAATASSVARQTFRDFEWIVHECGSERSKGSGGCAEQVLANLDVPNARIERDAKTVSLAQGRNAAIAVARGELIAILDGDDECVPDRLQRQVDSFDRDPELAVLGGAIEMIDERGETLGYREYPTTHRDIATRMRQANQIAHPTVMMRRDALLNAGGYRDYGEGACDDYELWSRMLRAGHKFANVKEVLLRYRIHANANKSKRLRATLRDTLRVKRDYWRAYLTTADRLRMLGERVLLRMPPSWVSRWFLKATLQSTPPGTKSR